MIDPQTDVSGWLDWLASRNLISGKLRGADRSNLEAYFLSLHGSTEAMLRQILFIGLRLNRVTYQESRDWLFHNDKTPDQKEYPKLFDRLYVVQQTTWPAIVASVPGLDQTWNLWLGFSKVIRNHVSHGIRKYKDEWLISAIHADQELLIRLDLALVPVLGGSVASNLTKLNPRLPNGQSGVDLVKLTGRAKPKYPRPNVTLTNAESLLAGLPSIGVVI